MSLPGLARALRLRRFAAATGLVFALGLGIACGLQSVSVLERPSSDAGKADASLVDREAGSRPDRVANGEAGEDARHDSGGCTAGRIGESCQTSEACCSGLCVRFLIDLSTCQAATGCLGVGQTCSYAGQCCSLGCDADDAGVASRACGETLCGVTGSPCAAPSDCCDNQCMGGSCGAPPMPPCGPAGESCGVPGDCCGRDCPTPTDGGLPRCGLLQGCRVYGEVCAAGSDCCAGVCPSAGPGAGRCGYLPMMMCKTNDKMGCMRQVDEICGSNNDCCSRICDPETSRCAPAGGCTPQCALCSSNGQCCSKNCVMGVCQPGSPACGHDGELCGGDGDCCMGSKCLEDPPDAGQPKRCVPLADAGCRGDGTACARAGESGECCGKFCVPGGGGSLVCRSTCVEDRASCTTGHDCCGFSTGVSDCLQLDGGLVCAPVIH